MDGPGTLLTEHGVPGGSTKTLCCFFEQARERLASEGVVYIILSSQSNLELLSTFVDRAGFTRIASRRRVFLETFIIYELRPVQRIGKPLRHGTMANRIRRPLGSGGAALLLGRALS
jgi:hypothetical protein